MGRNLDRMEIKGGIRVRFCIYRMEKKTRKVFRYIRNEKKMGWDNVLYIYRMEKTGKIV